MMVREEERVEFYLDIPHCPEIANGMNNSLSDHL